MIENVREPKSRVFRVFSGISPTTYLSSTENFLSNQEGHSWNHTGKTFLLSDINDLIFNLRSKKILLLLKGEPKDLGFRSDGFNNSLSLVDLLSDNGIKRKLREYEGNFPGTLLSSLLLRGCKRLDSPLPPYTEFRLFIKSLNLDVCLVKLEQFYI